MKESLIITAITQYLQYLENQGKLIYIRNNSGAFINPRGGFYKMGRSGSSDFIIFLQDNVLLVEVKNEKGKLSDNQIEFKNKIEKLGHKFFIVRSVDEIKLILSEQLKKDEY